jgi:hypothetical protein
VTKPLACLLFAAALAAANPYVETFLNEVGVDPAHQFIEINYAPGSREFDLTNWRIVTSTSACTLAYYLWSDSFLVVDSAALRSGEVGHGTLRLNPLGDSVVLVTDSGPIADVVHYPRYPTGLDSAPLPPATGGISFWNFDDFEGQSLNWYVDSTPTPGEANDNFSVIAGSLTGSGGVIFDEAGVSASGMNGRCHRGLYQQSSYSVGGLGAGTYQMSAGGLYQGHWYSFVYPDSVTVGYAQTASGINLVVPVTGIVESIGPTAPPRQLLQLSGRTLRLPGDDGTPTSVELHNQVGVHVLAHRFSPTVGERRIELPAALPPGVYFAVAQQGVHRSTVKVVLW